MSRGAEAGAGGAAVEEKIEISLEPVAGVDSSAPGFVRSPANGTSAVPDAHVVDSSGAVKIEIEIDPRMLHLDHSSYHQADQQNSPEQKSSVPTSEDGFYTPVQANTSKIGFSCITCGDKFPSYRQYTRHLKAHVTYPFPCNLCDKSFACLTKLKTHIRVHTNDKPFACLVCGRKMASKFGLEQHMRIHTGERPYDCTNCGKKFTQTSSLLRHMELHTRDKNFTCNRCGMKLSKFSQLKSHLQNMLCQQTS